MSINKSSTYNYLNGFVLTETSTTALTTTTISSSEPVVAANALGKATPLGLQAYPNPTAGSMLLMLNHAYTGVVQVEVIDPSGEGHKTFRFVKNSPVLQERLSLAELPAGIYYLSVQLGTERKTIAVSKTVKFFQNPMAATG